MEHKLFNFRMTAPPVQEDQRGKLWTDSLIIAGSFGREHKNVLRSIEQLIDDGAIDRLNFEPISYTDSRNREQRIIRLDERAFLIAMPFIGGRKARQGQAQLVDAFLTLRNERHQRLEARLTALETRLTTMETAGINARRAEHAPAS